MDDNHCVICVALLCLTAIVMYAMYNGMDGVVLASSLAILGVAIGVPAGIKIEREKA